MDYATPRKEFSHVLQSAPCVWSSQSVGGGVHCLVPIYGVVYQRRVVERSVLGASGRGAPYRLLSGSTGSVQPPDVHMQRPCVRLVKCSRRAASVQHRRSSVLVTGVGWL
jgi:hypothetical protein